MLLFEEFFERSGFELHSHFSGTVVVIGGAVVTVVPAVVVSVVTPGPAVVVAGCVAVVVPPGGPEVVEGGAAVVPSVCIATNSGQRRFFPVRFLPVSNVY